MGKKLTTEEYNKQIKSIGWEAIDEYQGATTKIKHRCLKCGNIRDYMPNKVKINKPKCYCCSGQRTIQENIDYVRKWCNDNNYLLIDLQRIQKELYVFYICPNHKNKGIIKQSLQNIKKGRKCKYCGGLNLEKEDVIKLLTPYLLNNEKIKGVYKKRDKKTNIISWYGDFVCPIHGVYSMKKSNKMKNKGCPKCQMSKGEKKIEKFLDNKMILFKSQYKPSECRYKYPLSFDFYIPSLNTAIEYNGEQHYMPIKCFGGEERFKIQQKRDKIKKEYCKKNNIKLLEIPYTEYDNIEKILKKELSI